MRFADMMNQLEQIIAWPDEPVSPNAVLVLEPLPNNPNHWPHASNIDKTSGKFGGKFISEFLNEAQPLPRQAIPRSITIEKYEYKYVRDDYADVDWPIGVAQVMPDFYSLSNQQFIVSDELRSVLETHCPGCVEYIEVNVYTPPGMIRAPIYYYITVLTRAQMVDWSRVDMSAHGLGKQRPIRPGGTTRKAIPYKPFGPSDPLIWHEMNLDGNHRSVQGDIMVRGRLWNVLVERFPLQFKHHTQLSKDE